MPPTFVRFQGRTPTARGTFPGVFALVNMLATEGRLSADQARWRRTTNAWFDEHMVNPSTVDPSVYDRDLHPHAAAWFRAASPVTARVDGYLAILTDHAVPWIAAYADDPGLVIYADPDQVVVVPRRVLDHVS